MKNKIKKKMKKTKLMGVVAIAMALTIAFCGVALASSFTEPAPENKIGYDRMEIRDHGFDLWKSSSGNLLNTGNVKYNENMIGPGVAADFNKIFNIYTGTGNTSRLGSLSIIPASWKEMNDKIDTGRLNDGSMAKGRISAGLSVYVVDGSDGGFGSRLSYVERSSASGSFEFHKVMDYTSKITTP
uniref:Uncharacterized protein n=1 Tax=Candidatus Methanophaga sp. ANME-1 ERB7 TaxID=2759913 RepID=A0A7G9Z435_9EURY|nr:hypothetical protein FPOEFMDM_00004 [Methanosarcinales archaeon ANME-1 ERB7]QNO55090.1 hypothetical protein MNNOGLJF_00004 [Methanosarcinales archaeon ANME-1 ERB7]